MSRSGSLLPHMSHEHRQALRNARSKVLQRLFSDEYVTHDAGDPGVRELLRWDGSDAAANAFGDRLYGEVLRCLPTLDGHVRELAQGWSLERMARIDRKILRIALWEILYDPEIPFRVSVHEALELAHQFSEPEAVSFINGILHEAAVRHAPEKGPYDLAPGKKLVSEALEKAISERPRGRT